jgi:hypothetical protein
MGILDQVKTLAESVGLWKFITTPFITYRTLTYEFLSTYTHDNLASLSFQLDGRTFTMTDRELNEVCDFPNAMAEETMDFDEPWRPYTTEVERQFEADINHPQGKGSGRASIINHPVLRYLQRAIGFSIFGRGETASNYHRRDVYLLFKMLYANSWGGRRPDLGAWMLRHLDHVTRVKMVGGGISVGGLVTRLAYHFNVLPREGPIYRMAAEPRPRLLDIPYLIGAKLIREEEGVFYHLPYRGDAIRMPLPPISLNDKSTWQAHPAQPAQAPPARAPPAQAPQQSQDPDGSIMQYLVAMNSRMMEQFGGIEERVRVLEASNTIMGTQIGDIHEASSSMGQQLTNLSSLVTDLQAAHNRHDEGTHNRFDDLYTMNDDMQNQMHDLYNIEEHMANFRIEHEEVPAFELPPRMRRTDLRHPFEFPPPPRRPPPRASRRGRDN